MCCRLLSALCPGAARIRLESDKSEKFNATRRCAIEANVHLNTVAPLDVCGKIVYKLKMRE